MSPGPHFTPGELASATGGRWSGGAPVDVAGVSTDTRAVAGRQRLRGPARRALRRPRLPRRRGPGRGRLRGGGPRTAPPPRPAGLPLLEVDDTLAALGAIARHHRLRFPLPVVGVTGSNGKTTTREMIAAILATRGPVLKTEGNLNNEVGVPLTLLRLEPGHTAAVDRDGDEPPGRDRPAHRHRRAAGGRGDERLPGPPRGAGHGGRRGRRQGRALQGAPGRRRGRRQRRRPAHAAPGPQVGAPRRHLLRRGRSGRRRGGPRRAGAGPGRHALPARHRHEGGRGAPPAGGRPQRRERRRRGRRRALARLQRSRDRPRPRRGPPGGAAPARRAAPLRRAARRRLLQRQPGLDEGRPAHAAAARRRRGAPLAALGDMLELGPAEDDLHRELGRDAAAAGLAALAAFGPRAAPGPRGRRRRRPGPPPTPSTPRIPRPSSRSCASGCAPATCSS